MNIDEERIGENYGDNDENGGDNAENGGIIIMKMVVIMLKKVVIMLKIVVIMLKIVVIMKAQVDSKTRLNFNEVDISNNAGITFEPFDAQEKL